MKTILTKYIGPTNFKGSRVRAYDCDGNSITIGYDSSLHRDDAYVKAARALCAKMGWTGRMAMGGTKEGNAFVLIARDESNLMDITEAQAV